MPGVDVLVVVDACQGRFTNAELAAFLADGAVVLVTGSKFYQGPPFSGALLIPPALTAALAATTNGEGAPAAARLPPMFGEYFCAADMPAELGAWRAQLPQQPNAGSAARWLGALAEMEAYHAAGTAASRAEAAERWTEDVVSLVGAAQDGAAEVFEANGSIVNVAVRRGGAGGDLLRVPELKLLHRWLTLDLSEALAGAEGASTPVFIGQPVEIADAFGIVRIALGAPDVRALLDCREEVMAVDEAVIAKINLVGRNFDLLRAHFDFDA